MACLLKSGDRDVVAIVTVEEHTSKAVGIDYVDITHSINGRLRKNSEGSLSSTRETGYGLTAAPSAATFDISIAEFLEIVNETHRSILSQDVLDHFNEERPSDGHYADRVLFSERDTESVSNRSLLANAFEGAARTDMEKQKIREYRDKIDLMNGQEQKLRKLNQQIKGLSFAKGKRDTAKIRELRDEATKTANRISIYDKQLLRLESSKPLQDVLEREKKKAYQRAEKKGKEALAAYRQKAEAKQQEIIERYQESRKKGAEGRKKTALRHKIRTFKDKLVKSLEHPTDRVYVPAGLINAMVDVCNLIDTDTDLYKKDGSINKAQEQRNLTKEKLQNLKDEYERLKDNPDPLYKGEFDEMVYSYLTELRENAKGKSINEMSLDELSEMYEILRGIEETLQDARKLIGWGEAEDVYEAADAIISEQGAISERRKDGKRSAAQKAKDATLDLSLSPVRNVERMSGYNQDSSLLKLFKKFEQGVRKKNKFTMDAYKSFGDLTSGKEYDDAVYAEFGKKYVDANGRKFSLSKMQMMQAILSMERELANGMSHIENSGFSFADLDMLRKGKLREAISEEHSHRVPAAVDMVAEFSTALKDSIVTIGSALKDGEALSPSDLKKLSIKALQVFGIPANNIIRTYEAVTLHAKDLANGEFFSFEAGVDRSAGNHIHRIVEAVDAGKIDVAMGMYEEAVEETAKGMSEEDLKNASSSLKTALGEHYKEGKTTRETAEKILADLFGMDDNDIYWTLDKWDYTKENGSAEGYSKYGEYYAAVAGNDRATASMLYDKLIAEKVAEGYLRSEAKDSIASSFTTQVKNEYMDGEISRSKAIDLLTANTDNGEAEVKKWDFELEHGFSWSARVKGYRLGKISESELISAVMDIEGESREEAEEYIRFLDLEMANQDISITASEASSYFEHAEPAGIAIDVYLDYKNKAKDITGEGKKKRRMDVIHSLPLTSAQKDALYYAEGWAASTIHEAPWH